MARTTSSAVKSIVTTSVADVTTPFIDDANLLVTAHLGDSGLSAALLEMIERYLAAHYVTISQGGQLTLQKVGQSSEMIAGKFSTGLNSTRYGQQAVALDTTGALAKIAEPSKKALFKVI
jgi:hypothetical protein